MAVRCKDYNYCEVHCRVRLAGDIVRKGRLILFARNVNLSIEQTVKQIGHIVEWWEPKDLKLAIESEDKKV